VGVDRLPAQRPDAERTLAEVHLGDVVGLDPSAEVRRLLPHEVHQFGAAAALLVVHLREVMVLLGQRRAEVVAEVPGGEAGVVFHLGRQGELPQRQRSVEAIVFGDRPLEHERIEVRAAGIDGRSPARRAAADDDEVFRNHGDAWGHLVVLDGFGAGERGNYTSAVAERKRTATSW
jgi:hypothetical protein